MRYIFYLYILLLTQTSCTKLGNRIAYGSTASLPSDATVKTPSKAPASQKPVQATTAPPTAQRAEQSASTLPHEKVNPSALEQRADSEPFAQQLKQLQVELNQQTLNAELYAKRLEESTVKISTLEKRIQQLEEKITQLSQAQAKALENKSSQPLPSAAVSAATPTETARTKPAVATGPLLIAQVYFCPANRDHLYHTAQCAKLASCRATARSVSMEEAHGLGYTACKVCY